MIKKRGFINFSKIFGILIFIPSLFLLTAFILFSLYPNRDGYLLTGLSFFSVILTTYIILPIILFFLLTKKCKRLSHLKYWFQQYRIFMIVISVIYFLFFYILFSREYCYFKDVVKGPSESIITDCNIYYKRSYRSSGKNYYISGYINGKKRVFELIDKADKMRKVGSYSKLKIRYYDNIGEVFMIDYFID